MKWKWIGTCIWCLLIVVISTGCNKVEKAQEAKQLSKNELRIGLIPEQNIFRQMERYEPLADYLGKKTGITISLTVLSRYGNIIDRFSSEHMDGAFFGSFTYALAHEKLGVNVLARPESPDGRSTYHGIIITRRDSGIKSVSGMKNRRFAFVDKATTAGYLFPLVLFKRLGVDYHSYLKEWYFAGTHEDVINDVLNRKADAGAVKNTVFERIIGMDNRVRDELIILDRSEDVPENAFAVRGDLDQQLQKRIQDSLLNMQNDPEGKSVLSKFGAKRFVATTTKDYQAVYEYARQGGLTLATYNYMND